MQNILQIWSCKGWQLKKTKSKKFCNRKQKQFKKVFDEAEANIVKRESDIQVTDAIIKDGSMQLEKVRSATSKHIQTKSCNSPNLRLILNCRGKGSVMKN